MNHSSYKTSTITGSASTLLTSSQYSEASLIAGFVLDADYQQNHREKFDLEFRRKSDSRASSACSAACCALSSSIPGSASPALTAPLGESSFKRGRTNRILRQVLVDSRNSFSKDRRRSSDAAANRASLNKGVVDEVARWNLKLENTNGMLIFG